MIDPSIASHSRSSLSAKFFRGRHGAAYYSLPTGIANSSLMFNFRPRRDPVYLFISLDADQGFEILEFFIVIHTDGPNSER